MDSPLMSDEEEVIAAAATATADKEDTNTATVLSCHAAVTVPQHEQQKEQEEQEYQNLQVTSEYHENRSGYQNGHKEQRSTTSTEQEILPLDESGNNTCSRPKSPSVYSELSRPDPPSIVDHQVLHDENDDLSEGDWEGPPREDVTIPVPPPPPPPKKDSDDGDGVTITTNTTKVDDKSTLLETHVDGKFVQKALSVNRDDGVQHAQKSSLITIPSLPMSETGPQSAEIVVPSSSNGLQSSLVVEDDEEGKLKEPPAVLYYSASQTDMSFLAGNKEEDTVENVLDDHPVVMQEKSQTPQNKPVAIGTDQEKSDAIPPEPTPIMSNGKSFGRTNAAAQRDQTTASTPAEQWSDVAQSSFQSSNGQYSPNESATRSAVPYTEPVLTSAETDHSVPQSMESTSTSSRVVDHKQKSTMQPSDHTQVPVASTVTAAPAFPPQSSHQPHPYRAPDTPHPSSLSHGGNPSSPPFMIMGGHVAAPAPRNDSRRKINLHLKEEKYTMQKKKNSFLGHFRTRSGLHSIVEQPELISTDRGHISVSWFTGTSAIELQEHVRRSVLRKLRLPPNTQLADLRILDESQDPPEGSFDVVI
jgi:hypothetical protein